MATGGRLSKLKELTRSVEVTMAGPITIGIDLGDRHSHCCFLGSNGACLTEGRIGTTPEAFARHFQGLPPARIAIGVGGHSRGASRPFARWGPDGAVRKARRVPRNSSARA